MRGTDVKMVLCLDTLGACWVSLSVWIAWIKVLKQESDDHKLGDPTSHEAFADDHNWPCIDRYQYSLRGVQCHEDPGVGQGKHGIIGNLYEFIGYGIETTKDWHRNWGNSTGQWNTYIKFRYRLRLAASASPRPSSSRWRWVTSHAVEGCAGGSFRIFSKHIARICLLMRQVDNQVLSVIDDHLRTEMDEHVVSLNQSALVVAFQSDNSHSDSSLPTPWLIFTSGGNYCNCRDYLLL